MKVKILSGGYGLRLEGGITRLVTKGSIVEVPEEEAERLIRIGCAEEIQRVIFDESSIPKEALCSLIVDEPDNPDAAEAQDWDAGMTKAQLRKIAEEKGIDIAPGATKAQIIEALGK